MQFATWFKNSSLEIKGDTACVLVSNLFAKNWLMSKYQDDILKAIQKSASDIQEVVFKVKKEIGLGHKEIIYQNALEQEFINQGNVRMKPEGNGFEFSKPLTEPQKKMLRYS